MRFFTTKTPGKLHKLMVASALTIGTLLLHSCSTKETPIPESAALMIVNTSPTPATFNVYVDGLKFNSGALSFGGQLPYQKMYVGAHSIKFTTASSAESLITKSITLDNQKAYSLFLVDKSDKLDYFVTTDEVVSIPTGKAMIRFINLSPDATSLTLGAKEGADVTADLAFKTNGKFVEIDPKKYVFQIKDKSATPAVKAELEETELKAGGIYTIISIGYLAPTGTDQKVTAKLIVNQ